MSKPNSLAFKLKLVPKSREVEFSRLKNGYLESGRVYFPHAISIDYASENWSISRQRLLKDIEKSIIELKNDKIKRADLVRYQ